MNLGLLLRRELALDADEAPSLLYARAEVALVDVGEDARDLLGELVRVDHAIGVGEKRRALDVGREQPAAAIEDVRTMDRRGNVEDPARARPGGGEAERDEPRRDQGEGKRKGEAGKPEAVAAAREAGAFGSGGCGIWSSGRSHGRSPIGPRRRPTARSWPRARPGRSRLRARSRSKPSAWLPAGSISPQARQGPERASPA